MTKAESPAQPAALALRARLTALSRPRRIWPWVVLLLALGLVFALVMRYGAVHTVVAVRPEARSLQVLIKGAGELTAREQADIASKSALKVQAVLVDAGQFVQRGQPLLLLDSDELAAQVRHAQAAAQAARQAVEAAELAHRRTSVLHQRAAADADRAMALESQGPDAIAASEVDAHVAAAYTSQLDAKASQVQVTVARQAHAQALANLAVAQARWRDATLRAPFDGLVTSRHCSAGDTAAPGVACLTVVDPTSLRVRARFDESVLAALHIGDGASLVLKSQPQEAIQARAERLNRSVDIDTREFTVDFALAQVPTGWALGERAAVTLRGRQYRASLTVPLAYVATFGAHRGVWVEQAGRARWQALRLGADDGETVEVLKGLAPDTLVLRPSDVKPAMRVLAEVQPW